MAARGNDTHGKIYIPAHKYFRKINVWEALKKYAVSAMMETQKESPYRAATPSQEDGNIPLPCRKQGGYFFFMATI